MSKKNSNKVVRVRFALNPKVYLHLGNAHTTLFNYLFAKNNGGIFVLRIEDNDGERSKKEYETAALEQEKIKILKDVPYHVREQEYEEKSRWKVSYGKRETCARRSSSFF